MPACFPVPWNVPVDTPSPRVLAGLGVIPRIVRDGAEIYRAKLAPAEAQARGWKQLYRPYHAALMALVEETLARFGVAIVIDCHSMPSALSVPDIVLGDRYGASAPPAVTGWAENAFADCGFQRLCAIRPMPAAIPLRCTAVGLPGAMRCRSRSIAAFIWKKTP